MSTLACLGAPQPPERAWPRHARAPLPARPRPGFSDPTGKKLKAGAALSVMASIPLIGFSQQPFTIALPTPGMVPAVALTVRGCWERLQRGLGAVAWGDGQR
jgi:hypothetical protein